MALLLRSAAWNALCLSGLLLLVALGSPVTTIAAQLFGRVQSGDSPIASSTITMYRATKKAAKPPVALATARSDADGYFTLSFNPPSNKRTVLYLIADGGNPLGGSQAPGRQQAVIRLASVLGTKPIPTDVVINERTTVASAFALAQFIKHGNIAGKSPGMQNAAAIVRNLVDLASGQVGAVLGTRPNGPATSTLPRFNTLANLLALCVNVHAECASFFALATPPRGGAPTNTFEAVVNIAHNPWQNVEALFDLAQAPRPMPYLPALERAPDAWVLAIKYVGNGDEFDGPGNMVVDKQGNVWSTNNYVKTHIPEHVCGGKILIRLTPAGLDAPDAPYNGGGLDGAGFGITLDPKGNVWVSNFGFAGKECINKPPANSVSLFSSTGEALSPHTGYLQGIIDRPQGTVSDEQGNIWISNCGNNTITQYRGGNPDDHLRFKDVGLDKPFAIAIDAVGNAWITSSGNNRVVALDPNGVQLPGSPYVEGGFEAPLGIAIDSLGNVWVSNSRIIDLPCNVSATRDAVGGGSVTQLNPDGSPARNTPITGGGLTIPWGIAVDGNDNVWVANFGGERLTQLCGVWTENCPPGLKTGDPISPDTGYGSDALMRNTGVVIDPSGNVWVPNNWKRIPEQINPGGDGLVVFIGIAVPVQAPMIGPVQKP